MKNIFVSLMVMAALTGTAFAGAIKGKVFEKDPKGKLVPLPGVNVFWASTTIGTSSNHSGEFILQKPDSVYPILVFSYVGYNTDSLSIDQQKEVKMILSAGKELEEVMIVSRTKTTSVSKLNPIYAQKISGKELARCACCNLSESFETNASVDVSYSDAVSGVKTIKMLGLSGRYSQLMMENIPILRGLQSSYGLEYVPGTWMESIQVSKGTAAVKNGYESTTGQINIHYRQPDGPEKLNLYIYGNQDGKVETNFNYALPVNDKWSTMFLLHGEKHFREMDMNKDGFLDKPATTQGNFMNRWNYKSDHIVAKLGISFLDETREGGQKSFDHNLKPQSQDSYGIGIDSRRAETFAKLGYVFDRPSTSLGWVNSFSYFDRNSFYGLQNYDATQNNLYSNLIFQSYIGNTQHLYNTGLSLVYDDYDEFLGDIDLSRKEIVSGGFFEYTYSPSGKFSLLTGIRYDYSSDYGGFVTPRIHVKYQAGKYSTLRLSAGKGFRTPNPVAENTHLLASSRSFFFDEEVKMEEAWNYGLSMTNELPINDRDLSLVLEFYRTDFQNQLIVDIDQNVNEVHFYNLDGKSYSNSFQAEAMYELFPRFDLTAAFRVNDVKTTYHGEIMKTPLINKYNGLLSGSYRTRLDKWQFDLTAQFNGAARLPDTSDNPVEYQRAEESKNYAVLMAQITKNYRNWSFYLGGENLTGFTQKDPIIAANNPFGENFDASMVWGPIYGRMFYVGAKFSLNKD